MVWKIDFSPSIAYENGKASTSLLIPIFCLIFHSLFLLLLLLCRAGNDLESDNDHNTSEESPQMADADSNQLVLDHTIKHPKTLSSYFSFVHHSQHCIPNVHMLYFFRFYVCIFLLLFNLFILFIYHEILRNPKINWLK